MPGVIKFHIVNTLAWNGMCYNAGGFFKYCLRLTASINYLMHIVAINVNYMPIKCLIFISQWFKRHYIFRVPINLNVVSIDNLRKIIELVFCRKQDSLPCVSFVMLPI